MTDFSVATSLMVSHIPETHSTNSQLITQIAESFGREFADFNTPHYTRPYRLTADTQTGGRGQHGRTWQSPPGNVYLSVYVPMVEFAIDSTYPPLSQRLDGRLSLCVGYQLSQMPQITQLNHGREQSHLAKIGVKWVNDIGFYQEHRFNKLAGILIEPVTVDGKILGVVVGVGMNITYAPTLTAHTQEGLNYQAISLQELTQTILSAEDFYQPITQAIFHAIQQFNGFNQKVNVAEFLQDFSQSDILSGKKVQITLPTQNKIIGTVQGIDRNGCLQLVQNDGTLMPVWTGTIQVL